MYTSQRYASVLCCLYFLFSFNGFTQVGIGTTTPNENAILDVTSTPEATGGLLLPRVALTGTANVAPLTEHVQGMTVYNTNTAGDVTPGYYYNDGNNWVRIGSASGGGDDWSITGNTGTKPDKNFIGTIDSQPLRIRTQNGDRFDFTSNGRLRSYDKGTQEEPTYSWIGSGGKSVGMYSPGNGILGFSTGGIERFRVGMTHQILGSHRGSNMQPFFSFKDDDDTGLYSSGENNIGLATNGQECLRITFPAQVQGMKDGTAALPFYSWGTANNSTTGMFSPSARSIGFSTNALERFRIPNAYQVHAMNNGTAALPFYSWGTKDNSTTGMFSPSARSIGFSTNALERFRLPNAYQVHAMNNGTAELPFYSWGTTNNSTTGMFSPSARSIGFSTNALERFRIPNAYQVQAMADGTAALPFYSWAADANMGMYRLETDVLGFSTAGTERMRITSAGRVGVGIDPIAKLHVLSNVTTEDAIYAEFATGTDSSMAAGSFKNPSETQGTGVIGSGFIGVYGESTASAANSGLAGNFNGDVYVDGSVTYTGTLNNLSDERFKSNIASLNVKNDILKKVMQLSPKSYNWRAAEFPGMAFDPNKKSFGFIAQDLKEIFPELVDSSAIPDPKKKREIRDPIELVSGYYSVNYTGLIPILTEAIQEQQHIIDSQEERISKLEGFVRELLGRG